MEMAKKEDELGLAMLWNFVYGFADSLLLRSAVELRLADIIHSHGGGAISLSDLSSCLPPPPVDPDRLRRLMRHLVRMGLFTQVEPTLEDDGGEDRYGLSSLAAEYLVTASDKSIVPILLAVTDKDMMGAFYHIKDGLHPGVPTAFEAGLGKTLWEHLAEKPEMNRVFNDVMAHETRFVTSSLVGECADVFAGVGSLVDVGGGTGTASRAIAQGFPGMKCTAFDLPHVIADDSSEDMISTTPDVIINRVVGDMFESIPSADAVLMRRILHDWDDESCLKILKKCKEAVTAEGGKVIIVDIVLDSVLYHPQNKMMDLDMLLYTGGKERTEAEWKKLLMDEAGFKGYVIKHISARESVIVAFPH
ncbi:hypothetical protein H6P81_013583 [Aristolochia fimbriata]|uniref:Uncharacterized protein n=1 Tax=Aristolochia fimbriata TaxID=158543 RepID=A0AAV7EF49_ARIFI|nr:hypothetical protein H6P81_013583 [Aristolochia fimbriata]